MHGRAEFFFEFRAALLFFGSVTVEPDTIDA
jgi:hypothetical protein